MPKRNNQEHRIQSGGIKALAYLVARHPEIELIYAIPNGGARDEITGAILKREGAKPGIPDLHLPVARGEFHSLYIEVKTPKGALSKAQRDLIPKLQAQQNAVYICRSAQEIVQTVVEYLEG